ncbi:hypothetical protein L345_13819 [Ophiophagus hannah]|uniref:Uncharacterized protein n=1 Tax=Ophiophagus hannah TaxID=8665 RepID=V8NFM4_OPHHA|nr:hypothetical protein L345_13819 [Ophiophagus hannah]
MLCTVSLLLLFLLSHQDSEQDDWCDNPSTTHKRLDAIQEILVELPDDGLKIQILNFPSPEPAFKLPFASTLKPK